MNNPSGLQIRCDSRRLRVFANEAISHTGSYGRVSRSFSGKIVSEGNRHTCLPCPRKGVTFHGTGANTD